MEKLIRDRIPELAAVRGQKLNVRECRDGELEFFLRSKLVEEAEEAAEAAAGTPEELLAELADVMEVVRSLAHLYGWSRSDLERAIARKNYRHGAFDKGYVLTTEES